MVGWPRRVAPSPGLRRALTTRLEPGESAKWNLAPNMFSDWGKVEERDDMVFTVTTTRLDGADGEPLFVDDFGDRRAARLETLRAEFEE